MKKQRKGYFLIGLGIVLIVMLLLMWIRGSGNVNQDVSIYAEEYVAVSEVISELQFGVYAEEDWNVFFAEETSQVLDKMMLEHLLERLGIEEYLEIPDMTDKHVLNREEWNTAYAQILEYLDMEQEVTVVQVLILDTMEAEEKNVLMTNIGDFYTNLPITYFEHWKAYDIYTVGDSCLGVVLESDQEAVIGNVYLKAATENRITFLFDGAEYSKEIGALENQPATGVCDLVVASKEVIAIRMKQDQIEGNLLSYDDATIEIEGYGKISHDKKLPVYQTYGEVVEKSISDVVLGNMQVKYVTGENKVCAILISQPANIENIRVLLLAEDGGKFRTDFYLKSNVTAEVRCGEMVTAIEPGTVIHPMEYVAANSVDTFTMMPSTEDGMVYLCDAQGNNISNGYFGCMEVRWQEEGYTTVNQLPFETYLCAVVPSEMPSSYATEALKAQAICARSYAYIQLLRADLARYGAHINDSTSYQVYNKIAPTEQSRKAVYDTAGKVLTYEGNTIEAYYFSTSMGYTDTAEVWNVADIAAYGYLTNACLNLPAEQKDLSDETTFLSYITTTATGYDSDIKFYRWRAVADYSEKTADINQVLANRQSVSPSSVLCYGTDGKTQLTEVTSDTFKKLGDLKNISVSSRSKAGSILTLCLQYEKGMVEVKTEYNIRKVLGCGLENIVYQDGSENGESTMLPSAFCAISAKEDGVVELLGGGYGHGLGMSQNAANGMAKVGMSCEDILHYFYNGVEIEQMTR